jgi:hypothetical protein
MKNGIKRTQTIQNVNKAFTKSLLNLTNVDNAVGVFQEKYARENKHAECNKSRFNLMGFKTSRNKRVDMRLPRDSSCENCSNKLNI